MPNSNSVIYEKLPCEKCGVEIHVMIVRGEEKDEKAIREANDRGESHARLMRFCPYCMEERGFMSPLVRRHNEYIEMDFNPIVHTAHSVQTYPGGDLFLKDPVSPQEKASRLYRKGLEFMEGNDLASAETAFRGAADRFERIRLFRESGESVLQLLEVIEHDPKRRGEAEEIRKSAIRRGLILNASE